MKTLSAFLLSLMTSAAAAKLTGDVKLTASDGAAGGRLGIAVAISGQSAIVGAQFGDGAGTDSGSAYVYDAATGQQALSSSRPTGSEMTGSVKPWLSLARPP